MFVRVSPTPPAVPLAKGRRKYKKEAPKMQDESLEHALPLLGEGEDSCMQNTDSLTQSRSLTLGKSYLAVNTLQHV